MPWHVDYVHIQKNVLHLMCYVYSCGKYTAKTQTNILPQYHSLFTFGDDDEDDTIPRWEFNNHKWQTRQTEELFLLDFVCLRFYENDGVIQQQHPVDSFDGKLKRLIYKDLILAFWHVWKNFTSSGNDYKTLVLRGRRGSTADENQTRRHIIGN